MVSNDTKLTALFVIIAVILWYATTQFTENYIIQAAVLIGVGVILPLAISEWRSRQPGTD